MDESEEKCTVGSWSKSSMRVNACGRPVKGKLKDGTPACGIHIAVEKRKERASERWRKEWAEKEELVKQIKSISKKYGLTTLRYAYESDKKLVKVDFDELVKVLGYDDT